jgi:hypothetical protein
MSPDLETALATAAVVFACVFLGALAGTALRSALPEHHLSDDSKDVVKMATGLMATMSALVLGLLIASAKGNFDTQYNLLKEIAADVVLLDRVLAHYGPETKDIRDKIRQGVSTRLDTTWPEDTSRDVAADSPQSSLAAEGVDDEIRELSPKNEFQHELQMRALQIDGDTMHTRWLLFGSAGSAIQTPFLVVLVFWVTVIFVTFGLFAPRNGTVTVVLFVTSISVSCAIFLILELGTPFDGILKMSSAPLRFTIDHLGQ